MREQLAARLSRFGLTLHPEKTRVLRFGRFAREGVKTEGRKRPEVFHFLGFTHICRWSERGEFWVWRRTMRTKRLSKLRDVRAKLRKRRHQKPARTHRWLCSVVRGHYAYYGVPCNEQALEIFKRSIEQAWHRQLNCRSQRGKLVGARRRRFDRKYPLPSPQVTHPWPNQRFVSP